MSAACVFCRIVRGELPSQLLEDADELVVIRDIAPVAPLHLLIISRNHLASLNEVSDQDTNLLGHMVLAAIRQARNQGVSSTGYRLVMNCGAHGGQGVEHLHLHLVGGRQLGPIA